MTGGARDAKSAQESEGAEVFVRFPDGGFAVDGEAADYSGADDRSVEEPEMPEVGGFEPEENSGDDRTMSIRLSGPEALPGGCGAAAEQEEVRQELFWRITTPGWVVRRTHRRRTLM